jgi:hypothetical protein
MTGERGIEAAVAAYLAFYEGLTPNSLDGLEALCASDVRFRDPFNDVTGVAAYRAILERMFEDVAAPCFTVIDRAISGWVAYLRWDFSFVPQSGGAPWRIEGVSEVHFDAEGRVAAHLDHWDSGNQFYGRLPLLRHVIGLIRKRFSVESK